MAEIIGLIRTDNEWQLPIERFILTSVTIGHGLSMTFMQPSSEVAISLRIESTFELTTNTVRKSFDAAHAQSLCDVLSLCDRPVREAKAMDSGTLTLEIGDSRLTVPPDPDYEAWEIAANEAAGLRVVCSPGGKLVIWQPTNN